MAFLSTLLLITIAVHPNAYLECTSRLFNPLDYLTQLPSLSLPYVNKIPIPHIPAGLIKPSPVATTKVISVVTKYVAHNPVCIHSTGKKKPLCKASAASSTNNILTKEDFVLIKQKAGREAEYLRVLQAQIGALRKLDKVGNASMVPGIDSSEPQEEDEDEQKEVEEDHRRRRNVDGMDVETPRLLMNEEMKDLLIEDRLDKLEDVLPHYTRLRVYQTSTITVTRTRTNRMATATLMVKNCVPDGMDYCKQRSKDEKKNKKKKRKSKVATEQTRTMPHYSPFYYG